MFPTGPWLPGAVVAAVLGAALLGSGCQPRPQFKVQVTHISPATEALLATLWLVNPSPAPDVLSYGYTDVAEQVPPSSFTQFVLPGCTAEEASCAQNQRTYSFGLDFDADLDHSVALVGVAAIGPAAGRPSCLLNVLTGRIDEPVTFTPNTLAISFLSGIVGTSSCVPGELAIAEASVQQDTRAGLPPLDRLVVKGWGFKPDATLSVFDGCTTTPIDQAQAEIQKGEALPSTATKVVAVMPTQIIAQLGPVDLRSTAACASPEPKTVVVKTNQKSTPPFTLR